MLDLVARGDILDALIEKGQKSKRYKWGESWELNLTEIKEAVESVQYAPERMKGEWIEYPDCLRYDGAYSDDHIVCSDCGHVFSICDNCTEEFDFCPHCGADMRGE